MSKNIVFSARDPLLKAKLADTSDAARLLGVTKALNGACAAAALVTDKLRGTRKIAVAQMPLAEMARKGLAATTTAPTNTPAKNKVTSLGKLAMIDGDVTISVAGNTRCRDSSVGASVYVNAATPDTSFFAGPTPSGSLTYEDPDVSAATLRPVVIWHGASKRDRVPPLLKYQPNRPVLIQATPMLKEWFQLPALQYATQSQYYGHVPVMLAPNKQHAVYIRDYPYDGLEPTYTVNTELFSTRPYFMDMVEGTASITVSVGVPFTTTKNLTTVKYGHSIPCIIIATLSTEGVLDVSARASDLYKGVLSRPVTTILSQVLTRDTQGLVVSVAAQLKVQVFDDGATVTLLYAGGGTPDAVTTGHNMNTVFSGVPLPNTMSSLLGEPRRHFPMGMQDGFTTAATARHGRCVPGGYNRLDKYIFTYSYRIENSGVDYRDSLVFALCKVYTIHDDGTHTADLVERLVEDFSTNLPARDIRYWYDVLDETAGLSVAPVETLDALVSVGEIFVSALDPTSQHGKQKYLQSVTEYAPGFFYEDYAAYEMFSTEYQFGKQLLVLAGGAVRVTNNGYSEVVGVTSGGSNYTSCLTVAYFGGVVVFCGRRPVKYFATDWSGAGTDTGTDVNSLGAYAASCTSEGGTKATLVLWSVKKTDATSFLVKQLMAVATLRAAPSRETWMLNTISAAIAVSVCKDAVAAYKLELTVVEDEIAAASTGLGPDPYVFSEYSTPVFRSFWTPRIATGRAAADEVTRLLDAFMTGVLAPMTAALTKAGVRADYAAACLTLATAHETLGAAVTAAAAVALKNELGFGWRAFATMPPEAELL